ncbi:phage major capsid protein [Acidaminococcus massiliensis]|jgi:HK97 family phage major capsid protein|uniref:phage major capsid protein n=1 Tax=Acidaminococcus massiliensis TaxID=1852375 RepID=UPI0020474114|nr:phage major capsid protein [Acidaminococcus massiliensis]DAR42777.1 MAG TPA: major capsid protein [Caudoviricetes sp.]
MNIKALIEKRNAIVADMSKLFDTADTEKRSFNEDETKKFDEMKKEIADIDAMINRYNEARALENGAPKQEKKEVDQEALEMRAFSNFIRTNSTHYVEERADVNFTTGDNGTLIPTSIANKIIDTVKNVSPIFSMATKYNVKGNLTFPIYDESTQKITVAYATEFKALDASAGKFKGITLGGFLAGSLIKISRSLINNTEFDVAAYVINEMALRIAEFLEHELLVGTGNNAMTGVLSAANTNVYTTQAATAISADDLIAVQVKLPQALRKNTAWIMNTSTMLAIRQLKDGEGRYMLQPDLTRGFGYVLLGAPVYESDTVDGIAAGKAVIAYGDFSGLYVNLRPGIETQVLQEKYADEHATGFVAWFEADSKIVETQKLVAVKMKAA